MGTSIHKPLTSPVSLPSPTRGPGAGTGASTPVPGQAGWQPRSAAPRAPAKDGFSAGPAAAGGVKPAPSQASVNLVPGVLTELVDIAAEGRQRSEVEPAVAGDFARFEKATWALQPPANLPEAQLQAGGKYLVDGVPAVVNQLLRGDVEAARADGLTWSFLGANRQEWTDSFKNLFAFANSVEMRQPKMVFHATAREFTVGQTVNGFVSATENPAFAAKYVPHETQQRRVVAFLLEGSAGAPARAGLVKNRGWNEVLLPPDSYSVARVEKTALGEVVTLRPRGVPLAQARQAFGARMDAVVPETVAEF